MKYLLFMTSVSAALGLRCSSAIPVLTTHIPPERKTAQVAFAVELGVADYNWIHEGAWGSSEADWSIPIGAGFQFDYGLLKSLSIGGLTYFSGFELGAAATIRLHHHFSFFYFNLGMNGGLAYGEARDYAGLSSILTPEICIGFGPHVFAGYRYSPTRAKSVATTTVEEPDRPTVTTEEVTRYDVEHHNIILGVRFEKNAGSIVPHVLYIIDPDQEFHQVMFGVSFIRDIRIRRHYTNRHGSQHKNKSVAGYGSDSVFDAD
jgi:hypothetical protein